MSKHPPRSELVRRVLADPDALFTPGEVAVLLRVDPKTVTRYSATVLPHIRGPRGHRRYEGRALAPFVTPVVADPSAGAE